MSARAGGVETPGVCLDRREVARYLGAGKSPLTEQTEELVALCEADLRHCACRRAARRVSVAELPFHSGDLSRHLRDCGEAWVYALTLGSEADRLLRIWTVRSMALAAVGQACLAAYMDDCCDALRRELAETGGGGEYLLPPYSPGYGDFALSEQGTLLDFVGAKKIGLSRTDAHMLLPEKSVTAVAGITRNETRQCPGKCMLCPAKNCAFRGAD